MKKFWLLKSEPSVYSIDNLTRDQRTLWEGVRNYQARNFMRDEMKVGDEILFYHSSAEPPGIAGRARVSQAGIADPSQFKAKSEFFDPKAKKEKPIWICAEIEFVEKFSKLVSLSQLKNEPKLKDLLVLQKGQRLSVQPVSEKDFQLVLELVSP